MSKVNCVGRVAWNWKTLLASGTKINGIFRNYIILLITLSPRMIWLLMQKISWYVSVHHIRDQHLFEVTFDILYTFTTGCLILKRKILNGSGGRRIDIFLNYGAWWLQEDCTFVFHQLVLKKKWHRLASAASDSKGAKIQYDIPWSYPKKLFFKT